MNDTMARFERVELPSDEFPQEDTIGGYQIILQELEKLYGRDAALEISGGYDGEIQVTVIGERQPIPTDTSGQEIEVGDRVAYNYSGMVVEGVVEKINTHWTSRWGNYQVDGVIHVKMKNSDHISKVKNFDGILVIN